MKSLFQLKGCSEIGPDEEAVHNVTWRDRETRPEKRKKG